MRGFIQDGTMKMLMNTTPKARRVGKLGLGVVMLASLLACNTTRRGSDENAPPPMKPIEAGSVGAVKPAPTQPSAPVSAPPTPVAVAPAPAPAPAPAAPPPTPDNSSASSPTEGKPISVQAGLHRCELGKRVLVKRVASDAASVQVNWGGKDYTMKAVGTQSGAKRFEESKAGLAWVVISAKAFLLNTKQGQILANECKL